jgi:spore germination protein
MIKTFIVLLLFISFILTGCVRTKILDDLQLDSAIGYDYVDKDLIQATAVVPVYNPDKSISSETFTETSSLSKEILVKIDTKSPKTIETGKLELLLFSSELAGQGIFELVDNFQRDPNVTTNLSLAVVDGEVKELLTTPFKNEDTGMYISEIIEQNTNLGLLPKKDLHQYMFDYYSTGKDPYLPLLKLENDQVEVSGIALFDKDKLVGQIDFSELFVFTVLAETSKNGSYKVRNDTYVQNLGSKRKFLVSNNKTNPEITINVQLDGIIRQHSGEKIQQKKLYGKIEKQMEQDIKEQAEIMIKKFQVLKVDPLGLGEQVMSRTRNWEEKKWNNMYPTIHVKVKLDVEIIESGVVE